MFRQRIDRPLCLDIAGSEYNVVRLSLYEVSCSSHVHHSAFVAQILSGRYRRYASAVITIEF
jgi:hypothetical protein